MVPEVRGSGFEASSVLWDNAQQIQQCQGREGGGKRVAMGEGREGAKERKREKETEKER